MSALAIMFEVEYLDGQVVREPEVLTWDRVPQRAAISAFRLVDGAEVVLETRPPAGSDGRRLIYRRSTWGPWARSLRTVHVVGWVPHGPAFAVDAHTGRRVTDPGGFHPVGPHACDAPTEVCSWLQSPSPRRGEAW